MWIDEILNDIKKTRFSSSNNELFKNQITHEFITRDEYINLVLDDFLEKQKEIIISLDGLEILSNIESKINHNVDYLKFRGNTPAELNCKKALRQPLLTYIYWKYRHPNCPVRDHANMVHVKKLFGFTQKVETIITPITYTTTCHICGEKSTLIIPSYADDRIIFKCDTCNHIYQTGSDGSYSNDHLKNQYIRCDCELCCSIKSKIREKGINWFNDLKQTCTNLIENNDEYIETPNSNYMKKAYDIYMDNQNDERIKEILNHNPNSTKELLDIAKVISNLYDNDNYELIVSKLKRYNIIFDAKKKINVNSKIVIMRYLLDSRYKNYASEKNFDKFNTYIQSGDFIKHYEIDECLANNSIYAIMDRDFEPDLSHYYNILYNINIDRLNDIIYENSLYINPYFLKDSSCKNTLKNQINDIVENLPENKLELALNMLKSIENFNSKN